MFTNRETKAGAAAGDRWFGLCKLREQQRQSLSCDSNTGVAHRYPHAPIVSLHGNLDLTVIGELNRVGSKIRYDLPNPRPIAVEPGRLVGRKRETEEC